MKLYTFKYIVNGKTIEEKVVSDNIVKAYAKGNALAACCAECDAKTIQDCLCNIAITDDIHSNGN